LAKAQITESFADGDFTVNPAWQGNSTLYQVNAGQLQLNGAVGVSDTAVLVVPHNLTGDIEWNFWCKFSFSPSTQNFARVYLASDQTDLKGSLNGYYIQFGGVTGNTDSITLYKQVGAIRSRLIGGRPSTVSKSINLVRIKVSRTTSGNWELFSDTTGGNNFVMEGSATDNSFTPGNYFGVYSRYTSTNIKNIYFDDINIYSGTDTVKPKVDSIIVKASNKLVIVYSEVVSQTSAEDTLNYSVNSGYGHPVAAARDAMNQNRVELLFASPFQQGTYTITISGVKDQVFNTMLPFSKGFTNPFGNTKPIRINEIFADPTPKINLPDFEFIELYNPNNTPIDLYNWTISDGSSTGTFQNTFGNPIIPADSFIILCPQSALSVYSGYGNLAVLSSFPSLNNAGDRIILKDNFGNEIDTLTYTDKWYGSTSKSQGGWTLELVNPKTKCAGKSNWTASINVDGGTPGSRNSVYSLQADTTPPLLVFATYADSLHLRLGISESFIPAALSTASISIAGGTSILQTEANASSDSLYITLKTAMVSGTSYTLTINGLYDCEGNARQMQYAFLYLELAKAVKYGILINEIYSNPLPNTSLPNVEWLELYNTQKNPVRLDGFTFSDGVTNATLPPFIMQPDSFVILCLDAYTSKLQPYGRVLPLSTFPSLNNTGDLLVLYNENHEPIHSVNYLDDWYQSVIKSNGGWSLELIDPENPCTGMNNWGACSKAPGGTPGKINSIKAANPDTDKPLLLRLYPISDQQLVLYFSETMDSAQATKVSNYIFNQAAIIISGIGSTNGDFSKVNIYLSSPLQKGTVYSITIKNMGDCTGNIIDEKIYTFGLPEVAVAGDVIINEILFNPKPNGVDYVELYNKSTKVIDLSTLKLANTDATGQLNTIVSLQSYLLMPSSYICISVNQSIIKNQYNAKDPLAFMDVSSFPSYNDNEGSVYLINTALETIDNFLYTDKMHYALLNDKEGVSLERVDYSRPASEATNWQSAASASGYGTPGYQNSQFNPGGAGLEVLEIVPEVCSPDGDGYHDVVNISYKLPEDGYQGEITIYSAEGKVVRKLSGQQLLGISGTYTWNGLDDLNALVPVGIYIVYFEYFNLKGSVRHVKRTVAIAGKL
jgi:hypothetical protein